MPDYPTEVSQYLKDKYQNAALGDEGATQLNQALARGAGGTAPEVTTQSDLVKKEINNYLGIGKGTPAKKYNIAPGLVNSTGNSVLLNEDTGEYGNMVGGKWTPTPAMPYNKNEIEVTPYQQAQIDAQNRKNDIAEKKADALAHGIGGISAGLQYRMDHDAQEAALKEAERKKKEEEELNNPKTSPDQNKAAAFAATMDQAEHVFSGLEKEGYKRSGALRSVETLLPSGLQSDEAQKNAQAQRAFVTAKLRDESGAAISQSEIDTAIQQYFPQGGDSPGVVEQKRANRQMAIDAMKARAGKAAGKIEKQSNSNAAANATPIAAGTQPAPHGQIVKQNGKTYTWDGTSYQEAK